MDIPRGSVQGQVDTTREIVTYREQDTGGEQQPPSPSLQQGAHTIIDIDSINRTIEQQIIDIY